MPKIDENRPFLPVNIAVVTVSDTRSAADDRSGDALAERIAGAGHRVAPRTIVRRLGVAARRRSFKAGARRAPGPGGTVFSDGCARRPAD